MERVLSRLRIKTLQGQVEASRLHSQAIAQQFAGAAIGAEKLKIARRYSESLKETNAMQMLLEMLEREEQRAMEAAALESAESEAAAG